MMLRAAAVTLATGILALAAPSGWQKERRADPTTLLDLVVGIKLADAVAIEEALLRVSDPSNPDFGKHLTKAEVDRLARPQPGAVKAIKAWVATHGARNVRLSDASDFLFARVTVASAEAMLGGVEYHVYSRGDARIIRTESAVVLPATVAGLVDLVAPSTRFPAASSLRVDASGHPGAGAVTPAVIRAQYGINSTEAKNAASQQAAAGFDGQWASTSDLATFYTQFYTPAVGRELHIVRRRGAHIWYAAVLCRATRRLLWPVAPPRRSARAPRTSRRRASKRTSTCST